VVKSYSSCLASGSTCSSKRLSKLRRPKKPPQPSKAALLQQVKYVRLLMIKVPSTPNLMILFIESPPLNAILPPPHIRLHNPVHAWNWTFAVLIGQMLCLGFSRFPNFFYYHGTPDVDRLRMAAFYLDDPALSWY